MREPMSGCFTFCIAVLFAVIACIAALIAPARALEPPPPGMIEQMQADGTYDDALKFAEKLGNYRIKSANRGTLGAGDDPMSIAGLISENFGKSIEDKSASALGSMSPREFDWLELDLNHDRTIDERDVLALGFPKPKVAATLPSLGSVSTFCLIIDFSDYPSYFTKAEFEDKLFGAGYEGWFYRSLKYYYTQASYSQLTVGGSVLGWYRAAHPRTWYHPNDDISYPEEDLRREQLIFEAIDAADDAGTDFSQFDNDGDGVVDYFLVVWAGPHGQWATFWWGYQTNIFMMSGKTVDGVRFDTYSWQWERYYGFGGTPPNDPRWDPKVTIHETGHALGLPDYYDYDGNQGPDGGVGGLDMMDGNWGDHNCFSKYVLGWLTPTVAFTNLNDEAMSKSCTTGDPVIFMPGFDPVSPWSEYFMAQNRKKEGVDSTIPTSDLLLWHVDASINKQGYTLWDNSYTAHKLLRLMEADGLEEIELGPNHGADTGDFYSTGESLSPTSTPNSNKYDGSNPGITCNDVSAPGDTMTADFTMFTSNPPTTDITAPTGGTVNGDVTVTIDASDDNAVSKVQLIIDGNLVKEWTTGPWTGLSYTWNSLVDFNGSRTIKARAWDAESQVGSDSVTVTVSNTGVTSVSDDFESGLVKWRGETEPLWSQGTYTDWNTRTSPGTPTPLGTGMEAYVKASTTSDWHIAYDALRSQRIDATAFTRPLQLKFFYRTGDWNSDSTVLALWSTTDNGSTWTKVDTLALTDSWTLYTQVFDYDGQTVYFKLKYTGQFKEQNNNGRSANIDNFIIQQAPSNPPTLSWTNPTSDGATVSGNYTFTVNANDDGTVSKVYFYIRGSLRSTDTAAPWQYTRDTRNDDNHPELEIMAYAQDNHDLVSAEESLTVVLKNERPFPAYDDLETDNSEWSVTNDAPDPDWAYINTSGNSGTHSYAWTTATWGQNNRDQLFYKGETPSVGLRTIDLSTSAVSSPILKYYYKADFPTSSYCTVYFYNSWTGYTIIDRVSLDKATWFQSSVVLNDWIGYSGHIMFYAINDTNTNGTGMWIDDISVDNSAPFIVNVNPNRGKVGDSITITGSAFGSTRGSGEVRFNDGAGGYISQTSVTSWSNTSITCNIPTGAKSHATDGVWVYQGSQESNKKPLTVVLSAPNLTDLDENR